MELVWNITRAGDEAEALAAELRGDGVRAESLPCIAREPLPWPRVPHDAWLVITSSAVLPIPAHACGHRIAALGPKTAARVRAQGEAVTVETAGGVVALAAALEQWWEANGGGARLTVVLPTSDLALEQPEHAEAVARLTRFGDVEEALVYRVVCPPALDAALAAKLEPGGVVFFSPSAVKNYLAAAARVHAPAPRAVVAHGASTASAWNSARVAGWPDAMLHSREKPLARTLKELS